MKVIRSKAGKTLELLLELEGDRIRRIEISGDFMASPSSAIEELERKLSGAKIDDCERIIEEALRGAELVGVTPEDIISAMRELRGRVSEDNK